MAKSNEPAIWSLFSAGMMISALTAPILILLIGIALPLGWIDSTMFSYERMHGLVQHPLTRLVLFPIIALPLFTGAHRLLFVFVDVGLKKLRTPLAILLYGSAFAGAFLTAIVLVRFN